MDILLLILLFIWPLHPIHAISWYANVVDVTSVNFNPNKHMNYGIEAFTSGKIRLLYRQTDADMVTTINEGDQSFFEEYALKASISVGAINKKKQTDFQLDGCGSSPDEKGI